MITSEANGVLQTERRENESEAALGELSAEIGHRSFFCLQDKKQKFFKINCLSFAINKLGLSFESLASLEKSGPTPRVLHPRGAAGAESHGFSLCPRPQPSL